LHIPLMLGVVLMLFPFYWMVISSFKPAGEVMRMPPTWWPSAFTLESYVKMMERFPLGRLYFNSLLVCGIITALTMFTSSLVGYVLGKFRFRGRGIVFFSIIATMMIPFEVLMLPLYNIALSWNMSNTYIGLMFPALLSTFGIFLMRQNAHSIPDELLDSATIDGCSEMGKFIRIVHPLCTPVLSALAIFTFMWNWDSFLWPLLITNEREMYTLQLALAGIINERGIQYNVFMACATCSSVVVFAVFLIFKKNIIQGIAMTGLKI